MDNSLKTNSTKLSVALGLMWDGSRKLLITKRPLDTHCGGLWEFPGGKIEQGETPFMALQREIAEEVGLQVEDAVLFLNFVYQYPACSITFWVYDVLQYKGMKQEVPCFEAQWITPSELHRFEWPPGSQPILQALRASC